MADNVTLNSGSGGATLAADDIAGVHHQRVKIQHGADGSATDVSTASPLPVGDAGGSLTVDGTVTVQDGGSTISVDDGAGSLTIDGTVTIQDGGNVVSVDDGAGSLTIDNAALSVTGGGTESGALRVTLATDSTGVVSVDDNGTTLSIDDAGSSITVDGTVTVQDGGGALTVDNAGTFAVQVDGAALTALQLLDNLVLLEDAAHSTADPGIQALTVRTDTASARAGTDGDYQPLITDSSGRLHVNVGNTVTVGSHAVTNAGTFAVQADSVIPGTGATNLGKAEDAAHTTGDVGVMGLAVRRDADTSLVGTDGDYAPLQVNSAGSLKVAITAGAGSGGTSIADGATFTRNTTSITPAGAVVEASAPTLADTDVAGLSMTTAGALRVAVTAGGVAGVVEDAAAAGGEEGVMVLAVRRDAASSGVSADGDFAALSVTSDGSLRVSGGGGGTQFAEDAAHTTGDVGTVALAVRRDTAAVGSGTDGDYSTLNVDANGRLHVNVGNTVTVGSHAVTNAGTFATQVDGAALTALQLIDNPVLVDDAAFTPATSSVMMAGYEVDETATDSVDEGDAGAARMSADRKQYVIAHCETSRIYQGGTARTPVNAIIDAATSGDNTLVAAQGAGNIIRVHQLLLVASGTVSVRFESGAGGTALTGQMNLVANTGFTLPFSPTGWFETAANTLLNLELSGAVSVDGVLQYTVVT